MPLITAKELNDWIKNKHRPVVLDATWHPKSKNKSAKDDFLSAHIPSANFIDLNSIELSIFCTNEENNLDPTNNNIQLEPLGINTAQPIVLYDNSELHTSCFAYWLFRVLGFPAGFLYILDGGLEAYKKNGFKLTTGLPDPQPNNFRINFQPRLLANLEQIKTQIQHPTAQLIDLRHPIDFTGGKTTETSNLRSGHIPGSFCFPFFTCFDNNNHFIPFNNIKSRLSDIGINLKLPITTLSKSKITAAILNFILDCLDCREHNLYLESWKEWGNQKLYPNEKEISARPVENYLN